MKTKISAKLQAMRTDYEAVTGNRFDYFFCPMLLVDDNCELCEAHIVNRAFPNTARSWTIQRKDVDGFFGSHFESDFLKIEYKFKKLSPDKVIFNGELSKRFRPTISILNKSIGYYYTNGEVPPYHSKFVFNPQSETPSLVLKVAPEKIDEQTLYDDFQIEINSDLRLSALVSLLKSAYLTLFEMIGYSYALSVAGIKIGFGALGDFYNKNRYIRDKGQIVDNAKKHFEPYVNLIRPVEIMPFDFIGTCKDKKFFLCESNGVFWGCIIFIKISSSLHAVILPVYENQVGEIEFLKFVDSPGVIFAKEGRFKDNCWHISKAITKMIWPDNGASLYD